MYQGRIQVVIAIGSQRCSSAIERPALPLPRRWVCLNCGQATGQPLLPTNSGRSAPESQFHPHFAGVARPAIWRGGRRDAALRRVREVWGCLELVVDYRTPGMPAWAELVLH
jgi:hypothetical protein